MRTEPTSGSRRLGVAALAFAALLAAGCRQGMYDQPKERPLGRSDFFRDGLASRVPPAGTIARGWLREDRVLHTGIGPDGKFVSELPASFHVDRLRAQPLGYFFDVMTNGFNEMSSYASQVPAKDRWAIAAYVRALQLSRNAPASELSPADLEALEKSAAPAAAPEVHP